MNKTKVTFIYKAMTLNQHKFKTYHVKYYW